MSKYKFILIFQIKNLINNWKHEIPWVLFEIILCYFSEYFSECSIMCFIIVKKNDTILSSKLFYIDIYLHMDYIKKNIENH